MTTEEAIRIIEENKDKTPHEIKRILEKQMTMQQSSKFTSDDFEELLSKWLHARSKQGTMRKATRNKRTSKGDEER